MRLRTPRYLPIALGLLLLDAPARTDAAACNASDCLTNSAISQRVQPTTILTDNGGDVTFFTTQTGQLPNVMFILDNSTSMYELPQDIGVFPNASFVTSGVTPNGTTAASCHSNTWLEGRKDGRGTGLTYSKATTYTPLDAFYNVDPKYYFNSAKYYKYVEWTSAAPGGNATATGGSGACSAMSSGLNSGGVGQTQQQRCQQCLDETGYYIKPGTTGSQSDVTNGYILFKGNWLNFFPPKFLIARKAVTDFVGSMVGNPQAVRVGISTYDVNNVSALTQPAANTGLQANDGGSLVSSGMVPNCGVTAWATSDRDTLYTAIRGTWGASSVSGGISWGSMGAPIATPLAETLFNVGQFFTGNNDLYKTFKDQNGNVMNGNQWIKNVFTAPTNGSKPLCNPCQLNAVVLITDGEPYGDNNVPYLFRQNGIGCTDCGTDQGNASPNTLAQVASFLASNDLNTTDPTLAGIQDVITYVIGVGLSSPILDEAAKYGKTGKAMKANDANDLADELNSAVVSVLARSTAFSSTAIQTLEVGTGSTAYVPRFLPSAGGDPVWEGHLFRFDLFNEFVAGVDKNGDGKMDGVFLVDQDGDIVTEDDKGNFHKSVCSGGVCTQAGPANPVWDAGGTNTVVDSISGITKSPQLNVAGTNANRKIYTAYWDTTTTPPGWKTIEFKATDLTSPDFAKIRDALGLDGTNACAQIQAGMLSPTPSAYLSATNTFDKDHCAKAIIDFVRGQNILVDPSVANASGTTTTLNRKRMLGDIFHSSPVVVDPPVDQFICSLGLHAQCLSTLYGYQQSVANVTAIPSASYTVGSGASQRTIDAYEKYWEDHETRQKIVVVGSNDGLVHGFDAGSALSPLALNANVGFRQVKYDNGGGGEVWGFVPPDQLPRLWLMMRDGHQMYLDGDIMVRDVWVDGKKNDPNDSTYSNTSMVKQSAEYHTLAVISERQGGNHFVALDLTDTTKPTMLWMYPPPCDPDEQLWGQTWGQFSPRPPPIGPVLLQTSDTAGPANYGSAHTEERWVVFLNGGHGPYNTRGRAAAMLDVYTGAPLYKASYTPPTSSSDTRPSAAMRFGFPATAALVDYGHADSFAPDGFFDTAVIADEGGQVWTFRFPNPGQIDTTTKLVTNWTFGRAYEANSSSTNDPRYHQPIYTVASTTVQPENGWLRAYVGSGDRAHVRSTGGGDCRADDPMSCISAGCNVTAAMDMTSGPNQYSSTFRSASPNSASPPAMAAPLQTQTNVSTNACTLGSASDTVTVSACPNSAMNKTQSSSFTCTGSPLTCTESPLTTFTITNRGLASNATPGDNSFVSVAVLSDSTGITPSARTRRMNVPADAVTYDGNRLAAGDLIDVSSTTATTTSVSGNVASRNDAGWKVQYTNIDEKTVTSATILGGCVIWSTLIPSGTSVGCASAGASIAPFYQADAMTGAPNCAASFLSGTTYARTVQRNVISPPPEPSAAVAVGAGGRSMRFSTLEIQPGTSEVTQMTVGTSTEMLQMLYSLPLTAEQHTCRHADATKCP